MEIQPHSGQSPRECMDELCAQASKFVVNYYRELGNEVFPLHFDGRVERTASDQWLATRQVSNQHTLASLDWEMVLPEDRVHIWRVSAAIVSGWANQPEDVAALMTGLANADDKTKNLEAQRNRAFTERDEARQMLRSLEGKIAEYSGLATSHADELRALRPQLNAVRKELAEVQENKAALLEELGDRDQRLAKSDVQLEVLRQALSAQGISSLPGSGELEVELNRAWQENAEGMIALEGVRLQMAVLQTELAVCKKNLDLLLATPAGRRQMPEGFPASPKEHRLPTSIVEALQLACDRHPEALEVSEDAWRSAKASHFSAPTCVLEALHAIAEVGLAYFMAAEGGPGVGPLDQAFQAKVPFKYAPTESQTTMAMYGHERVFQCNGTRREIQRHLTLGGGGNCLQIYFDFDETQRKTIIAYCGQHLSHYRQS